MEEPASIPSEKVAKKSGRPRKSNVANSISLVMSEIGQSEAQDGGGDMNPDFNAPIAPENGTRQSERSKKAAISYQQQLESDEEPTVKRQKKKIATHDNSDSVSDPSAMLIQELAKPKTKRALFSSPRKSAEPKARGVKIRTEYTSEPFAVSFQPSVIESTEATNNSLEEFTRNGQGQLAYHGESNETDEKMD